MLGKGWQTNLDNEVRYAKEPVVGWKIIADGATPVFIADTLPVYEVWLSVGDDLWALAYTHSDGWSLYCESADDDDGVQGHVRATVRWHEKTFAEATKKLEAAA